MKSGEISKQIEVLQGIAEASNAIRNKYKTIKSQRYMEDEKMNEILKPVVIPLKKMVSSSRTKKGHNTDPLRSELPTSQPSSPSLISTLRGGVDDSENNSNHNDMQDEEQEEEEEDVIFLSPRASSISSITMHSEDPLINDYLTLFDSSDSHKKLDMKYGVYKDPILNSLKIGNVPIKFQNSIIKIGDMSFSPSKGLLELLFMRMPNRAIITERDYQNYAKIIKATNVHLTNYDPRGEIRKSKSKKFQDIILKLVKDRSGGGLPQHMLVTANKKIDYVYWDDKNELVDRLRLLLVSQQAGNSNHNNEIISIIEELREAHIVY